MELFIFTFKHVIALTALVLISYTYGNRVLRGLNFSSPLELFGLSTALGLGIIAYLVFFMGIAGLLNQFYLSILFLGCFLGCFSVWKSWFGKFKHIIDKAEITKTLAIKLIFFLMLIAFILPIFILALYPPTAWDATMYHFPFAKLYETTHYITFSPDIRFSSWPQTNEMLFTLMLIFSDDISAQLVQFLMMLLVGVCLYSWGRRTFSNETGIWAVALWFSSPLVVYLGTSGYIDVGLAMFVTFGLYAFHLWLDSDNTKWLAVSGAFLGLAAGSKYSALFFLGITGLFIVYKSFKKRKSLSSLTAPTLFAAVGLAVASIWYVRSYILTGNPVFPFFSEFFGYSLYDRQDLDGIMKDLLRAHGTGKSVLSFLTLPWNLVFNSKAFMEVPISPVLPLSLPLFLIWGLKSSKTRYILFTVLLYFIYWFLSAQIQRYLLPIIPVLSLGVAAIISMGLNSIQRIVNLKGNFIIVMLMFVCLISPGPLYAAYKILEQGPIPCTDSQRDSYIAQRYIVYDAIKYLNDNNGSNYTVYSLFAENLVYYADGVFKGEWFGPSRYRRVVNFSGLNSLVKGEELYKNLKEMNADYFLVTQNRYKVLLPEDDFFKEHFKLVYSKPYFSLYELSEKPVKYKMGEELLKNNGFEDLDEYNMPVGWIAYNNPIIDISSKNSKTGRVGVKIEWQEVDSTLYQDRQVAAGEIYQLSCYARGDTSGQKLRLQVNWLDKDKQFLKYLDLKNEDVTTEWKKYYTFLTVPEGAAYAKVYVRPEKSSSVWFDDFSFRKIEW